MTTSKPKSQIARLGRIQAAVLESLRTAGKPMNADEMAAEIFLNAGYEHDGEPINISHVLWSSIRRAINSLARKRLICVGHPVRYLQKAPDRRIVCWLPEHKPPELILRTNRRSFRTLVLLTLEGIDFAEASRLRIYHSRKMPAWVGEAYIPSTGDVPYTEVIDSILRKCSRDDERRVRMACYRAVISLLADGSIEGFASVAPGDRKPKRRVYFIRLPDVAL